MRKYGVLLRAKTNKEKQWIFCFETNTKQEAILKAEKEVHKQWKGTLELVKCVVI